MQRSDPMSEEPVVRVQLSGEYDISRREELEQAFAPAHTACAVVIEMGEVTYLDSTALTCLVRLRKRMLENGDATIRIAGAKPQIRRIFALTQLERVFNLED